MTTGNLPGIGRAWKPTVAAPLPIPITFQPAFTTRVDKSALAHKQIVIGRCGTADPWDVIGFDGPGSDQVWTVLECIDGTRTIGQIARASGQPDDEVRHVVQGLYHAAVVEDCGGGELPAVAFYEHLRSAIKYSVLGWGGSPLMDRLWSGPVSRRLAIGYLVESYHFAVAASSHQAAAIAAVQSERLKTAFSEHLSSEYWHYVWLKRGLVAAGFTDGDFERAVPLPASLGQVNHLRWLATSDPLAYSVCIGITERNAGLADVYKGFWTRYASHGVLDEAVYAPFREHELLDAEENHEAFGAEVFVERGPLTKSECDRIRQRVLAYAFASLESHRQTLEWYEAVDGPLYFALEDDRSEVSRRVAHSSPLRPSTAAMVAPVRTSTVVSAD